MADKVKLFKSDERDGGKAFEAEINDWLSKMGDKVQVVETSYAMAVHAHPPSTSREALVRYREI